jgi:hypothetical protein
MAKPARADSSLEHTVKAVGYSVKMLAVAVEMDSELTEDDVVLFRSQGEVLAPHMTALDAADTEARLFDRGPKVLSGMRVSFGDMIQDRAVRWGNRMTKAELLHDTGSLGAEYAFGQRVEDLVKTKLELEPEAVLRAVDRLGDLPEFSSRERIATRLTDVATRQGGALEQRVEMRREENTMDSRHRLLIVAAAEALGKLEATLLERFPRQYEYVGEFFLPSTPAKKPKPAAPPATPPE